MQTMIIQIIRITYISFSILSPVSVENVTVTDRPCNVSDGPMFVLSPTDFLH